MRIDNDFSLPTEDAHIDLTPLIDVIFMLVIFFILTMSFTHSAIDINLPKSTTAQKIEEPKLIEVAIRDNGDLYYDKKIIDIGELKTLLDSDKNATLNIIADAKSPFDRFIEIVDVAKEKRAGKFLITTDKKYEER